MAQLRRFPANWPVLIGRVEKWLVEAIEVSHQRERNLAEIGANTPAIAVETEALKEASAALASCSVRTTEKFAQLDAELEGAEESMRQWVGRADSTRRKLAEWVDRALL